MSTRRPTPATRYRCSARVSAHCVRGHGRPRTDRCRTCRAGLIVEQGWHGVFAWRGDGRYPEADAIRLFKSPTHAEPASDVEPAATPVESAPTLIIPTAVRVEGATREPDESGVAVGDRVHGHDSRDAIELH